MADRLILDTVRANLQIIQNYPSDKLARTDKFGPATDFSDAVEPANNIIDLCKKISVSELYRLSDGHLSELNNLLLSFVETFNRILEYDTETGANISVVRQELSTALKNQAEDSIAKLWPLVLITQFSNDIQTDYQNEISEISIRTDKTLNEKLSEVEKLKIDVNEILSRVKDASAEAGVSKEAGHFSDMASLHNRRSFGWLCASIVVSLITIVAAVTSIFTYKIPQIAPKNNIETAQLISSKLIIISILGYLLVTCVRNFLSHKHNSEINRHRQNSLLTYRAFVDAAPTTDTREVVLRYAAQSVFSPQDTGYIKNQELPNNPILMDLAKGAASIAPKP